MYRNVSRRSSIILHWDNYTGSQRGPAVTCRFAAPGICMLPLDQCRIRGIKMPHWAAKKTALQNETYCISNVEQHLRRFDLIRPWGLQHERYAAWCCSHPIPTIATQNFQQLLHFWFPVSPRDGNTRPGFQLCTGWNADFCCHSLVLALSHLNSFEQFASDLKIIGGKAFS